MLGLIFCADNPTTRHFSLAFTCLQVGLEQAAVATYKSLLTKLPGGPGILEKAYSAVDKTITDVTKYVDEWLRYQALWDLQPDSLVVRFKEDISQWMQLLSGNRAKFFPSEVFFKRHFFSSKAIAHLILIMYWVSLTVLYFPQHCC